MQLSSTFGIFTSGDVMVAKQPFLLFFILKKLRQKYNQSVKGFGSRSGPIFWILIRTTIVAASKIN